MSWRDYQESKSYGDGDPAFYALIMAAMRRADSSNARKLREAFPATWDELQARYDAPGGYLPDEVPPTRLSEAAGRDGSL